MVFTKTGCVPQRKRDKNKHELADRNDDKEQYPHLTLKCGICDTKPTSAARFPSHALQFLELLEFANNIPSAVSAESLAVEPAQEFHPKKLVNHLDID